jgi:DNA polymerase III alpha subunit
MEQKTAKRLLDERKKNGLYESLEDFVRRAKPGIEQLILLIRVGAFRFTGKSKPQLLWEAHLLTKAEKSRLPDETLFQTERQEFVMPALKTDKLEDAYDETELLGFPVTLSPFDMLQTKFRGEVRAMEMINHTGHTVRMLGQLITIKYVRTKRKEMMHFATFLDDSGEMFDTTHFPNISKQYPFHGYGIYLLKGKITEEFGYAGLEVEKMAKMPLQPDPRHE